MNPRLSPKRFEPGEGGGAPLIPGEEARGGPPWTEGLRLRPVEVEEEGMGWVMEEVGGVPTGEALEEEEVEVDP
jgi:hypothetical protein